MVKKAEDSKSETAWAEDLVEIPPLFYDSDKYSAPKSVIYNGKHYLIQRGVSGIKVPRAVAIILADSAEQNKAAQAYIKANEGIKNRGDF